MSQYKIESTDGEVKIENDCCNFNQAIDLALSHLQLNNDTGHTMRVTCLETGREELVTCDN